MLQTNRLISTRRTHSSLMASHGSTSSSSSEDDEVLVVKSSRELSNKAKSVGSVSAGAKPQATEPKRLHASKLFEIVEVIKTNTRLKCIVDKCGLVMWHSHAKEHIKSKHPARLAEYEAGVRGSATAAGGKISFPKASEMPPDPNIGTAENLLKQIAFFLIHCRLALRIIEMPVFRNLVITAINFGYRNGGLRDFKFPSRKTFVENVVEGPEGIVVGSVDVAHKRLEDCCQTYGASLLFDGAKDACGRGVEVFMMQTGGAQALLMSGLPGEGESKDAAWMGRMVKGIIGGRLDFDTMTFLADAEVEDQEGGGDDNADDAEAGSASKGNKKQKKTMSSSPLKRLFELTPHVFAVGGDNASAPVRAARDLEEELGTLPFGCVAHAFSRTFQHVCEIEVLDTNVLKKANKVVDLFLSRHVPRELLRTKCDKSLYRLIPTRFISAVLVCERLLELRPVLENVVDSVPFDTFRKSTATERAAREQCTAVKEIVHDVQFWRWLEFFVKMSIGFVVAVRCMDGAKAGSVCLVYKIWSLLAGTVTAVFRDEPNRAMASEELLAEIGRKIDKAWKKFHFKVYAAGYVLNPHFRDELSNMLREDPLVGRALLRETEDCITSVYRRFDVRGCPRKEVLEKGGSEIEEIRARVNRELEHYSRMRDSFGADLFVDKQLKRSPADWWDFIAPPGTILRQAAMRITSLSPSTTPVERLHKVFKSQRTKARNRLGYARALGLNFVSAELCMSGSAHAGQSQADWGHLSHFRERFVALSADDRSFLDDMQAQAVASQQERQELEDEEQIATVEQLAEGAANLNLGGESEQEGAISAEPEEGAPLDAISTEVVPTHLFFSF